MSNLSKNSTNNNRSIESFGILRSFITDLYRYRLFIFLLATTATLGSFFEHQSFPKYRVQTRLYINTTENSPLQILSTNISGLGGGYYGSSIDYADKYLKILRTQGFYEALSQKIIGSVLSQQIIQSGKNHKNLTQFLSHLLSFEKDEKNKKVKISSIDPKTIESIISGWINFKKESYDTIAIVLTTPDSAFTAELANIVANTAVRYVNDFEIKELGDAEKYLLLELSESKKRLSEIDRKIVKFKRQSKLLSMNLTTSGQQNISINIKKEFDEAKISLKQNESLIKELEKRLKKQREVLFRQSPISKNSDDLLDSSLNERINQLKVENEYLNFRKETLSKAINEMLNSDNVENEQQIFEFQKQIELEYSLFQNLQRKIFETSIMRISISNRIRVFEEASDSSVFRDQSLSSKLLFSLLVSLIISSI
ncbi:MAG: hypothetical protein CL678_07620, partial [Bdellovibrionaceae bacterium]|nr:hypothetical protein [Pseudobdellovibrionaceae bacterium]